jgi:hypothetical protein
MQSLAQWRCRSPTQSIDTRNVAQLARHTIRARRIEEYLSLIPHDIRNQSSKGSDADVFARSDIEKSLI